MAAHLLSAGAVAGREEEEYSIKKKQFVRTAYFIGSSFCPSKKRVYIEENQEFIPPSSIIYP
jgi:hypothetical protein